MLSNNILPMPSRKNPYHRMARTGNMLRGIHYVIVDDSKISFSEFERQMHALGGSRDAVIEEHTAAVFGRRFVILKGKPTKEQALFLAENTCVVGILTFMQHQKDVSAHSYAMHKVQELSL